MSRHPADRLPGAARYVFAFFPDYVSEVYYLRRLYVLRDQDVARAVLVTVLFGRTYFKFCRKRSETDGAGIKQAKSTLIRSLLLTLAVAFLALIGLYYVLLDVTDPPFWGATGVLFQVAASRIMGRLSRARGRGLPRPGRREPCRDGRGRHVRHLWVVYNFLAWRPTIRAAAAA